MDIEQLLKWVAENPGQEQAILDRLTDEELTAYTRAKQRPQQPPGLLQGMGGPTPAPAGVFPEADAKSLKTLKEQREALGEWGGMAMDAADLVGIGLGTGGAAYGLAKGARHIPKIARLMPGRAGHVARFLFGGGDDVARTMGSGSQDILAALRSNTAGPISANPAASGAASSTRAAENAEYLNRARMRAPQVPHNPAGSRPTAPDYRNPPGYQPRTWEAPRGPLDTITRPGSQTVPGPIRLAAEPGNPAAQQWTSQYMHAVMKDRVKQGWQPFPNKLEKDYAKSATAPRRPAAKPASKASSKPINERSEFPKGADKKTSPDEFKRLRDEETEALYDSPAVEETRKRLQTKLRKPK